MRPNYQFIATSSLLLGTTCTECFQAPTSFSQKRSLAIDGSPDGIVTNTFGTTGNDPRQKRIRNTRFYASGSQNSESIKKEGQATTNEVVDDNPLNRMLVSIPFLKPQEARLKEGQESDSSGDEDNPFAKLMDALPQFNFGESDETRLRKRDLIRTLIKKLANLSLQDYYWRSDYFKKNEADRQVEESLARMMGEEAAYVRPMDASEEKRGPLGRAEQQLVKWLSLVIEEEGRRARLISSSDGDLVRPMDMEVGGPLSNLESAAVTLFERIRTSEKERVLTSTLRPKDLEEQKRGPLGDLEAKVVNALDEIRNAERLRMEQSRRRGGEIVRPIDVPGPLGELERWYLELITAEKQRAKDREMNNGGLVRPKDATIQGPMGTAELEFSQAINVIKEEETERLKNVKRLLEEKRPMEADRDSPLGILEAIIVGIFRAPQLLFRVIDRVRELLDSETLSVDDKTSLQNDKRRKE